MPNINLISARREEKKRLETLTRQLFTGVAASAALLMLTGLYLGGRTLTLNGRPIDFRVSILPSYYGESCVLRILDKKNAPTTIDQLGFSKAHRDLNILMTTERTDSLSYAGVRENLVLTLDQVTLNSWNEVLVTRFDGEHALLDCLRDYLNNLPLTQRQPRLQVRCFLTC